MRYLWLILIVCLLAGLLRAAEPEKPLILGPPLATLKPVSTLEDLKKLDPIQVGDASIRLALEAEKVPLGSGLLVYCLWDGKGTPPGGVTRSNGQQKILGPCIVQTKRIYQPGELHQIEEIVEVCGEQQAQRLFNGEALFITPILPPAAGKYELSVLSKAGDLIAHARITCADDPQNPPACWRSLSPVEGAAAPTFQPNIPMVPRWDDAVLTELPKTLPAFLPAADHPDLEAAADHGAITLRATHAMRDEVSEALLVRVFINGRPVTAQQINAEQEPSSEAAIQTDLVNEMKFSLPTRPEDYGAAQGDTVEVQFLYCPRGTDLAPREHRDQAMLIPDIFSQDSAAVRLSNKVLIFPGTKKKPAASQTTRPK